MVSKSLRTITDLDLYKSSEKQLKMNAKPERLFITKPMMKHRNPPTQWMQQYTMNQQEQ